MCKLFLVFVMIVFSACAHKAEHHHDDVNKSADRASAHEHHHDPAMHAQHRFNDAEKWAKAFDNPERDEWQKPNFVVENLGLGKTKCVADIGAGTGYFSTRIAKALPKNSIVYAVDVEPDMVNYLKQRATKEGLNNHKELLSKESFPEIPKNCDLVLLVDTYHHIANRTLYFKEGRNYLGGNGKVAIIDFTMDSPIGPKKSHRLKQEQVVHEMQLAGYKLEKEIKGLPNQYFLIFQK